MTPEELEGAGAEEVLRWALREFSPAGLALAASFGAEDMVLIDLFHRIGEFPRIVTLDTGRLPQETQDLIVLVRARYGCRIETYAPDPAELEPMLGEHGPNLFYESVELRKLCCRIRKVHPMKRALAGCRAWVSGLRRDQAPSRAALRVAEPDEEFGALKLSPLAAWTESEVWEEVRRRNIPVNRLHGAGYPSIGCAPCTRAVKPGEDPRAGRWWWETPSQAKECGLHPPRRT